jgi:protein-S-isoprenylcysteine O-methyltransferase Ste14
MSNGKEQSVSDKAQSVNDKSIEMRLTAVKEAMQRSRFVFIVMTIASTAILFTLWNDRFSRDKDLAFTAPAYSDTQIVQGKPTPLHVYGRQQLVSEWYKNRIIQVGILGIRLSVSDLAIMGSFTLVVITIWFYYSQRRENRATVSLLRDVQTESAAVRDMVYQVTKHSSIFIKTEESDEPLEGLSDSSQVSSAGNGATRKSPGAKDAAADGKPVEHEETITDKVVRFLAFLPFWTVIAIMGRDIAALFMRSPTAGNNLPLGQILIDEARRGALSWDSTYPLIYVLIFDTVALLCAVYIYKLCKRSRAFALATRNTLSEFEGTLGRDEPIYYARSVRGLWR